MTTKATLAACLLIPILGPPSMVSGDSPGRGEGGLRVDQIERIDAGHLSEVNAASCSFAIRAKNNLNLNIWIDLYDSTVTLEEWWVPAMARKEVKLAIQNHRLTSGQSMDRRYTSHGSCDTRRSWKFLVRIDRPSGTKVYQLVLRSTQGSGDRTVNLGNTSTWGL